MEYGLIAAWLTVFSLLGLLGLPLAGRLFDRFPDRGASLSLPLALALVGVVTYWVGHLSLTLGLLAGLVVLLGLSVLSLRETSLWRRDFRRMVGPVVVFALAFLFMVAVRAVDPAVHPGGGEKFLDFGLLKSLLRTSRLPPEDFWFAGKPVRYYYGGHLLAAVLTKLTFTEARYAYNLALAGFFGMLVTAAYGLAGAIAAEHGRSARMAGAFAAFFVGVASNLETPARAILWALPDDTARTVAGWLGVELDGLAASPAAFSYWDASRVIPGTVNEFPLFAWLNGDLHAHMMSTPFLLLAAACWFAYYRAPADALARRRALAFGAVPPIAGLLTVINTWSFPTVAGIGWLALTFADAAPVTLLPRQVARRFESDTNSAVEQELGRVTSALSVAAVVLVLGVVWSLPFWFGSASGRAIDVLPERSALGPLVLVYGAFLLVFVPYLAVRTRSLARRTRRVLIGMTVGLALIAWVADAAALVVFGPLLLVGWLVLTKRRNADCSAKSVNETGVHGRRPAESDEGEQARGLRTAAGERSESDGGQTIEANLGPNGGFETVLLVAGVGLVLLVEFVYIVEEAGPGRFNTVFKTYAQVWVLFGTAAGTMAAWLAGTRLPTEPDTVSANGGWRVAGCLVLAVLVVSMSLYGALALTDQFTAESDVATAGNPTLDALAFVTDTHPEEAAAIRWLDGRTGQPHIVSLPGCWCNEGDEFSAYRWVNAPSSLTGLPTVAGWDHEVGYRGSEPYLKRVEDVTTIYEGDPEERARLLEKYDVRYIYVGPNERAAYGVADIGELQGVSVAQRWDSVTIYHVNRTELPA